jgi:hypothetical protein
MFNGTNQPVLRQDDANAGDVLTFTETEETSFISESCTS